jgi:4-hydroxy-3-methylbut-2-enyl diphosphate reductase
MTSLLKTKVKLRITEVNQSRRRVVGSIRAVINEERREKAEKIWNEIEVGKKYQGVVKSMTSYGAFIDIGGIDGMVHVSELSWTRIHQPSEILNIGDQIEVFVLSFDKEKKKISLGYKTKEDNPWEKFVAEYKVGDRIEVKVVKLMPFGAFAEIIPGVDGLIHISQIADHRIGLPSEVLSEGMTVEVKITDIDHEKHKVSLSIRALMETEAEKRQSDLSESVSESIPESVSESTSEGAPESVSEEPPAVSAEAPPAAEPEQAE